MAFARGWNVLIISTCLGESEFATITTDEIIMHGINTYRGLQKDTAINEAKIDSRIIALTMNFGLPMGIPTIPVTTIEDKINTIAF